MTLRNTTLTAVAALAVALAGGAMAQDSTSAVDPSAAQLSTQAAPVDGNDDAAGAQTDAPAEVAEPADEAEAEAEAEDEAEDAAATTDAVSTDESDTATDSAEEAAPEAEAADEEPAAESEAEDEAEDQAPLAAEEPAEAEATDSAEDDASATAEDAAEPEAEDVAVEDEAEDEAAIEEDAIEEEEEEEEEEAAEELPITAPHIEDIAFSFEGPFGKFDQFQLQRGFQVYSEVCAACHGLRYVPLRTLSDSNGLGMPEDQIKAYAAELEPIMDPETEEERPRLVTDHFPTVSGEGMGPDLSLMAKARAGFHGPYGTGVAQLFRGTGGPEYIHAILVGYDGETKEEAGTTLYHNTAFDGNWIQMMEPLMDDMVTYEDGTPATVDQMARDVSAFLMWTAEPKMMDRKQVGLISVLFLVVLAALLYLTNKRLWWPIKHRNGRD